MAFCPKCKGEMGSGDTVCPHCGYDFPAEQHPVPGSGFIYGRLAQTALVIGEVAAGVGCIVALIGCVVSLLSGHLVDALVRGPIGFFLLLAMFVVFARVLDRS